MQAFRLPRRHLAVRLAVAFFLAGRLAGPSVLADTPDVTAPPAMRKALHAAWEQHPSYRATEAQLAAARARLDAAGQPLYNPEIELAADDEGADRYATAGVNFTLDLRGKRHARRDAAAARMEQATAEARLRRRDFVKQWFSAWADIQSTQRQVRIGERRLALVARFAELARKQFEADDISGLERDLALLARDEAEADQSRLLAERAIAESSFRALGGLPESVVDSPLPTDALPPPAVNRGSTDKPPELQAAEAAALAAEREVAVARGNRKADPTVGVRGGRVDYGDFQDDVFGVSVSIPLFVRNSFRAEVVAAQADAEVAIAEAERLRLELETQLRSATESYAAAQAAWTRWQASPGTNVERRALLLERLWREGEVSTADYLLQLKQTLDTALAGAELEARLWHSYVDYLAATGQLERWSGLEGTP